MHMHAMHIFSGNLLHINIYRSQLIENIILEFFTRC